MSGAGLTTLLLLSTILLYVIGRIVAAHYLVDDRRFEKGASYTAETLGAWVKADGRRAYRYACPVLFPIDLLFMFALGGLLAVSAVTLAGSLGLSARLACLAAVWPALYVAADLVEDVILAYLFTSPDRIGARMIRACRRMNRVKFWTLGLAVFQILGLAVAGTVVRCSS